MQYLLDFIHDHTLEERLFFVIDSALGELELLWQRRVHADHWQVRPRNVEGPAELVHRQHLLQLLAARSGDMAGIERELQSMVATQIAFADMVLADAHVALGREMVESALRGHHDFIGQLQTAIAQFVAPAPARPKMTVVPGGGLPSATRSGHLTVVT
jgi:hypothetical protein